MTKTSANQPSQVAVDLIKTQEGFEAHAYPDPGSRDGNPWTVGYGSTGPDIKKGTVWTQRQAEERLIRDVVRFGMKVAAAAGVCSQNELDAMTSFAYNVGLGAFRSSTLLRKHLAGDHEGAAHEFARWNKNDGKVMKGLVNRRAKEAALYLGK